MGKDFSRSAMQIFEDDIPIKPTKPKAERIEETSQETISTAADVSKEKKEINLPTEKNVVKFQLALPKSLHAKLKETAKNNGYTLNGYVRDILTEVMK